MASELQSAGGESAYFIGNNKLSPKNVICFRGWMSSRGKMAAFITMEVNLSQKADNTDANLLNIILLESKWWRRLSLGVLGEPHPIARPPQHSSVADEKKELFLNPSLNCQFGTEKQVGFYLSSTKSSVYDDSCEPQPVTTMMWGEINHETLCQTADHLHKHRPHLYFLSAVSLL